MPTFGGSYLFVLAGAVWSLLLCVFIVLVARRVSRRTRSHRFAAPVVQETSEKDHEAWIHGVNPRSTLLLILSMVLFSLSMLLLPMTFASSKAKPVSVFALLGLLSLISLGIAYAVRKRDLFWKKELKDS